MINEKILSGISLQRQLFLFIEQLNILEIGNSERQSIEEIISDETFRSSVKMILNLGNYSLKDDC